MVRRGVTTFQYISAFLRYRLLFLQRHERFQMVSRAMLMERMIYSYSHITSSLWTSADLEKLGPLSWPKQHHSAVYILPERRTRVLEL